MKQETNNFKLAVAVDLPRDLPRHVACISREDFKNSQESLKV